MSCAHDQLEWAGLRDEVFLHDGPTTAAQIEWPVGFVYLDDGKSRFWNECGTLCGNLRMIGVRFTFVGWGSRANI